MKVLSDLDVAGKRVFLRADLDVPLEVNASETATRLKNLRETVEYLLAAGCEIVIAGHIDRPQRPDPRFSTKILLPHIEKILEKTIVFQGDFEKSGDGLIVLLENLRFWPGEVENDLEFAKKLANLAEVYINEAFGNSHRNHASMVALPSLLPHAAGLHLQKEVETLTNLLNNPQRPLIAVVGGAKVETKVPVIENLAKVADLVLVGGELPLEIAKSGQKFAENVIVGKLTEDTNELSEESTKQFIEKIKGAKTIVWNGPVGYFEKGFEKATLAIANAILEGGAYSVVGGGDTTQFLANHQLLNRFSFVSAGGGAMLEFLAGRELPALKALE